MDSGVIIALLAVFTIGIVLAGSIFHFGFFVRDPRNRGAARNVLVEDGPSATTEVRDGQPMRDSFKRPAQTQRPDHAEPGRSTMEGHNMAPPPGT
jgi:hypothetical protein